MRRKASIIIVALFAILFVWGQWKRDKAIEANCTVVAVLLENRSDRDKTIKLFDSIRQEDPVLFDELVKRAKEGDERLKAVQDDLACDI